jgi:hypothetical protein
VVVGSQQQVELPLIIEQSNYFANMMKRAASGEAPRKMVADLERFLAENTTGVWENSWVRFPFRRLSAFARQILEMICWQTRKIRQPGNGAMPAGFIFRIQKVR